MTEAEWLTSTDPLPMLRSLIARYGAQKRRGETPDFERLRLFACGCLRRVWDMLDNDQRRSVELIEEYVRTQAPNGLLAARRARRAAGNRLTPASPGDRRACLVEWSRRIASSAVWQAADKLPTKAAYSCLQVAEAVHSIRLAEGASANGPDPGYIGYTLPPGGELPFQAALLRAMVGNPFANKSLAPDTDVGRA